MTWLRTYWTVLVWIAPWALIVGVLVAMFLAGRRAEQREAEEATRAELDRLCARRVLDPRDRRVR